MKCPRCGKEEAIVDSKYGVLPGKKCQAKDSKTTIKRAPEFYSATKADRVTQQRDIGAKDILQPFVGKNHKPNPDFAKAYPNRAKDYFKDSDLNKL